MTKQYQLELFKPVPKDQLDLVIRQLNELITAYKYLALLTELNIGKTRGFLYCVENARLSSALASLLSPSSDRYKYMTHESWVKRGTYEPYYSPLEPRSPYALYKLWGDVKSSSNSFLLRFKPISDYSGEIGHDLLRRFKVNMEKIELLYKKQYNDESEL